MFKSSALALLGLFVAIAAAASTRDISLINIELGKVVLGCPLCASSSTDGTLYAYLTPRNTLFVYDSYDDSIVFESEIGQDDVVKSIAILSDNQHVAIALERSVTVLGLDGSVTSLPVGHGHDTSAEIQRVIANPVSPGYFHVLFENDYYYEGHHFDEEFSFPMWAYGIDVRPQSASFSPDGRNFYVGSEETLYGFPSEPYQPPNTHLYARGAVTGVCEQADTRVIGSLVDSPAGALVGKLTPKPNSPYSYDIEMYETGFEYGGSLACNLGFGSSIVYASSLFRAEAIIMDTSDGTIIDRLVLEKRERNTLKNLTYIKTKDESHDRKYFLATDVGTQALHKIAIGKCPEGTQLDHAHFCQ